MRKVHVTLKVRLVINADDDINVEDIINELSYNFEDTTTKADVEDYTILDYEVADSK